MSIQDLFNAAMAIGFGIIGWWAKTVWNAVQELKRSCIDI